MTQTPENNNDDRDERDGAPGGERARTRSLWARLTGERRRRIRPDIADEFQPDALEIEHHRPPFLARVTTITLLAAILALIVWSAFAQMDRVVVAPGKLVTTSATIVLQPLETSVIREVTVQVGDVVREGDLLARLDPTFTEADVSQLRTRAASLRAHSSRLDAEMAGQVYAPTDPTPDEVLQLAIFNKRQAQFEAQIQTFDSRIAEAEARLQTKRNDVTVLNQRRDVLVQIEEMRTELESRQHNSLLSVLEARDSRLTVERQLHLARDEIIQIGHTLAGVRAEKRAFVEEWRQKIAEELVTVRRDLESAMEQLNKALRRQEMVLLRAPRDAVVLDIAKRSASSVARQAEPLFTLVPIDVPLEAEVAIRAQDIGFVSEGDPVHIKFDAFPFQKHGTADGLVRTISEDAFTPGSGQNAGRTGGGTDSGSGTDPTSQRGAYYRARVEITDVGLRNTKPDFRLIPGMTVSAEIKVGKRSALSYFLYPLMRASEESLREP